MSPPLAVQTKAVKAKRIAITGEPSITGEKVKISKSQSALVNQYTTMEKKLKAQVTTTTKHPSQCDTRRSSPGTVQTFEAWVHTVAGCIRLRPGYMRVQPG